jgi:hypothetical protein
VGNGMEQRLKAWFGCKVCAAHEARIADLKDQIARLTREKENERAEYKRAVDALLVKNQSPAIGQGVPNQTPFDPTNLFKMFEEEVKEKE